MIGCQHIAALGLGLIALLAGGCVNDAFRCASARQCQNNGESGMCQPNGFCSFPDDECPSGQRYGSEAPLGLANVCVEPESAAGTDGATTVCTSLGCSGRGETTSNSGSEESTQGGAETTTATDPEDPNATSGTTGDPGTGSNRPRDDCPQIVDEFDDGVVDDLLWTIVTPHAVSESAGTLHLAVDPPAGTVAGVELPELVFDEATIRVDVVGLSPHTELPFRVVLEDTDGTLEVSTNGAESVSVRLDGALLASVPIEDAAAGVSLELLSTLGGVYVLAGPAGAVNLDLLPLGKFGVQYLAVNARLSLLAGVPSVTKNASPFSVRVDRFDYCATER